MFRFVVVSVVVVGWGMEGEGDRKVEDREGAFNGWGSHMEKVGFIVLYNVIYIYCSYIYIVILYIYSYIYIVIIYIDIYIYIVMLYIYLHVTMFVLFS